MNKLYLSEAMLTDAFWPRIRRSLESLPEVSGVASKILEVSRIIHQRFPQDQAGSISKDAVEMLWLLARYFRPRVIAEVGTFIGRSALALSEGAGKQLQVIHTCDYSFSEFEIPPSFQVSFVNFPKLTYHGKTSSTEMLSTCKGRVDLFFLDGRLGAKDLDLIKDLRSQECIFIMDDFEGVEKGVSNALLLRQAFNDLVMIRPEVLFKESVGVVKMNIGLMFTAKSIQLSRQQDLPLDMS